MSRFSGEPCRTLTVSCVSTPFDYLKDSFETAYPRVSCGASFASALWTL
jgi:hypothetical protein